MLSYAVQQRIGAWDKRRGSVTVQAPDIGYAVQRRPGSSIPRHCSCIMQRNARGTMFGHAGRVAARPRLAADLVVTTIGYTCILYAHRIERSNAAATRSLSIALGFHDRLWQACLRENKGI
jgi:hypothetical protein